MQTDLSVTLFFLPYGYVQAGVLFFSLFTFFFLYWGIGQEEKGLTEDEMVGWHHRLNGHEFEQTLRVLKDGKDWHAAVHGIAESNTT